MIQDTNYREEHASIDQENTEVVSTKKRGWSKKLPVLFGLLLGLTVITSITLVLSMQKDYDTPAPKENQPPTIINERKETVDTKNSTDTTVISSSAMTFHKPQLIKEVIESETTYLFYKVGSINEGEYKDYEIIKGVLSTMAGPCKGPGCGKPIFTRYLKKGTKLTLLPLISEISTIDQWAYNQTNITEWKFELNNKLTLEPFEIAKEINYNGSKIELVGTEEGVPNTTIYKLYEDPKLGSVYTTAAANSPQEPFYSGEETPYFTTGKWGNGKESCYGMECYLTNGFFVFNPDGTFQIYKYSPKEITDTIYINGTSFDLAEYEGDYYYRTRNGCSGNDADYLSVEDPAKLSINDLSEIGTFKQFDKKLYFFKNTTHSYLKHFYDKYKLYYPEIEQMRWGNDESLTFRTFEDFVAEHPVVFFEDDFGRLIRLTKREFVVPYACEPVIYLYPEQETKIEVKLDANLVQLIGADPEYQNGWQVIAKPNGEISSYINDKNYSYLFWEGTIKYLPKRPDGFVIMKNDIISTLTEVLPKLGLNKQETNDFIEAWAPKLAAAPYYFITFHSSETIDTYAPLTVDPTPETTIRVLMEYQPLKSYTSVPPFKYPEIPGRNGFTLVEWGGIER